jgi:hypothetical protein
LAEYIIDHDNNPLLEKEYFMYILDAVPMLLALLLLNVVHPGRVLVGPESNYHQGKKDFKAQKKANKKAAKMGYKGYGGSEEEESMIGIDLRQQQPQHHVGWVPSGEPRYGPLNNGQQGGVIGGGPTLYDPHHGQM